MLLLRNGDDVVITQDSMGRCYVNGAVKGSKIIKQYPDIGSAIRHADHFIKVRGGQEVHSVAVRAHSRDNEKPDAAQISVCRGLKIQIPLGATSGELRLAIAKAEKRMRTLALVNITSVR